jgi:PBSX family phage terminase large subunit
VSLTVLERPTRAEQEAAYEPRGAARALLHSRAPEVLAAGPSGTGKSRGCLEKLNACAWKYPGMRALIVRKTRESLSESGLVTFEDIVIGRGHPLTRGAGRHNRQVYSYSNGSEIVVAGMDKPQKVMSTDYDLIYVQEATELEENDWEMLTTRLRHGVMPYQQIIADCNPSAPTHWLKRRCERGQTLMLHSRHEDNPSVTAEYLAKLDTLTGVRHKRLRLGLWVAAEGMVFDNYDPAIHVVKPFVIPPEWPRYRVIDFGYTNPFVCQWWAKDGDGRLYMYREVYGTQRLVEDWGHTIYELSLNEPPVRATICDHDAEDRATLKRHMAHSTAECKPTNLRTTSTTPAFKDIEYGVKAVKTALNRAGDGRPRLMVFQAATIGRDPLLDEAKKPCSSVEEVEGYVWDQISGGRLGDRVLEVPLEKDNHGMDCWRYIVATMVRMGPPLSEQPSDFRMVTGAQPAARWPSQRGLIGEYRKQFWTRDG